MPYTYAGQLLRVRVTSTTVTVFDGDQVICEHVRRQGRKGQYSTDVAHAPTRHRGIDGLWSKWWFTDRARGFGPATEAVIAGIINRHAVEAQGYLDCQNILESLGKRNKARLEPACQVLLDHRYSSQKNLRLAQTTSIGPATGMSRRRCGRRE
ncbi:hypothetical protein Q8Z05_02955 [Arthrobacter oryzae]|nr:hypothetical protein [Arthrobacter oryzae]WLQ07127.1 hypothetical protein Q8Z05_02955 [Arthrobacter oryzae]